MEENDRRRGTVTASYNADAGVMMVSLYGFMKENSQRCDRTVVTVMLCWLDELEEAGRRGTAMDTFVQ